MCIFVRTSGRARVCVRVCVCCKAANLKGAIPPTVLPRPRPTDRLRAPVLAGQRWELRTHTDDHKSWCHHTRAHTYTNTNITPEHYLHLTTRKRQLSGITHARWVAARTFRPLSATGTQSDIGLYKGYRWIYYRAILTICHITS